jgi:aminoglycoside phosphotransferase family enzyme/predicted kinase
MLLMDIQEYDHKSSIIELMQKPDFYPHPVRSVTLRETHISSVFLTGDFAYKIKKPVNLDFLDFTSLEKRHHFCRMEVDLNRRLTHGIYLGVVSITANDQTYSFEGPGETVEYAIKMKQLPDGSSMARLLLEGKIDTRSIDLLAQILAKFYNDARSGPEVNAAGSWDTIKNNCEENFAQTEEFSGSLIDKRMYQIIQAATTSFLQRRKSLFDLRVKENKIREGHGDLRTGHIYFATDGIQIIDCIEFNQRFRCSDIASDLAFLAMDLDFEGSPDIARKLLTAYIHRTGDWDVVVLMDFYKCYRAFVRLKVNCLRLKQGGLDEGERTQLISATGRFIDLAYRYALQFARPTVWVVCGMIASGKSTVAKALAVALQIKVLRSDVVRKKLFDRQVFNSQEEEFGEGIYSQDATSLTYGKLLLLAHEEIERGRSVILDATFSREDQRREVLRLVKDMDADIVFVECRCRDEVIRDRLEKRDTTSQVTDARLKHLDAFKAVYEALDEISNEILISIDTERPLKENVAEILSRIDMPVKS